MENNILLLTDSYKVTHYLQYPPKTKNIYSYFESRGGEFDSTVFFGLQYYLKEYLEGEVITLEKIVEARELFKLHFGNDNLFNEEGWIYILDKYKGKLPVKIKAVPEGSVIPTSNVLMTIENTDPKCYWLTNYLETLLVQVWYGTTVATLSYQMKKMMMKFAKKTIVGDPFIDFKLHDFGFRGVSSVESAAMGGAAHLLNFQGTDTLASLKFARDYYKATMPGFSIPASEHSTITAWGVKHEKDAFANMLGKYPTGLVACVSDSYDIFKACKDIWGTELRQKVLDRDGVLVIRPDSGNPPDIVIKVLELLGGAFGYERNNKGFMVLNPKVRVIQGDGCNYDMCQKVLQTMQDKGWSVDNIAFGMGGALLQKLHRDTQQFAFKCSAINRNGNWEDVYKKPVTDSGKNSKRGRLELVKMDGKYQTVNEGHFKEDELVEVFRNGKLKREYTFDECRERIKNG